jgi:uncharacterized protein DUF1707
MNTNWDPPWYAGSRSAGRRADADLAMRVSDAERNEVAEVLSKHYADGRLDAAEFKERLDRAMGAKTRADLSGLLTDLPRSDPQPPAAPRRRPHLLVIVAVALVVTSLWAMMAAPRVPWLLIGLVVLWLWRRDRRSWARARRAQLERPW